jgi:hypothetical protein
MTKVALDFLRAYLNIFGYPGFGEIFERSGLKINFSGGEP